MVATMTTVLLSDVALVSELTAPAPSVVASASVAAPVVLDTVAVVAAGVGVERVLVLVLVREVPVFEVVVEPVMEGEVLCDEVVPGVPEEEVLPPVAELAGEPLLVVFTV